MLQTFADHDGEARHDAAQCGAFLGQVDEQLAKSSVRWRGEAIDPTMLGLADSVFPDELLNGEQQRIAVARAIAARSSAVLADEPSASQDEATARLVFQANRHAAAAGTTSVIAGHDPITLEYVDHHIRMRDDRIVSEGSPGA